MLKQLQKAREASKVVREIPETSVAVNKPKRRKKPRTLQMREIENNLGPYLKQQLMKVSGIQYTDEMRTLIIEYTLARVTTGMTIAEVSEREGKIFPEAAIIYNWIMRDPELAEQHRLATERSVEAKLDMSEHEIDNTEDLEKTKLKIKFHQWYASKKKPKEYGESRHLQIDQNISGDASRVSDAPSAEEAGRIYAEEFFESE